MSKEAPAPGYCKQCKQYTIDEPLPTQRYSPNGEGGMEVDSLGAWVKFTFPQPAPVQDNPLDCGVYLGSGKDHAIKHHVSYEPAQPVPNAFEQLMREADKPTQVLQQGVAEYVDALMDGTHEITSVTIRPKRTWVGLTDEERKLVRNSVGYNQFVTAGEYAEHVQKATEFKLLEKNNG